MGAWVYIHGGKKRGKIGILLFSEYVKFIGFSVKIDQEDVPKVGIKQELHMANRNRTVESVTGMG